MPSQATQPNALNKPPKPIKLIAIDIDGTLLDSNWRIPESNRLAIVEALSRGIDVVLVTGRRFDFALPVASSLPDSILLICSNGALIKKMNGETYLRHLLDREIAREVLAATASYRIGCALLFDRAKDGQVVYENINLDDPDRRAYYNRNREFLLQVKPLESALTEDPIQVMFTGGFERMRAVKHLLETAPISQRYSVAITEYEKKDFSILDINARGISKGTTLKEWTRRIGIEREEVMAVGDNWNDHDMLEFAGFAVVMGNCVPELRNCGWPVTLTNDEGGLGHAIRTYALAN